MYKRRNTAYRAIVTLLSALLLVNPVIAQNIIYQCNSDINRDGDLLDVGEASTCVSTQQGQLCPIGASACNDTPVGPVCAENPTQPCYFNESVSQYQCSQLTCSATQETQNGPNQPTDEMLTDDGERDANGNCLDQLMIFTGKVSTCKTSGKSTGFKNCCVGDAVYFDSTGSIYEGVATNTAITMVYEGVAAGYAAYSAGATAAEAGTAAYDAMAAAFNPATIAIALVVAALMAYFNQPCDEPDMQTAMMNSSGYCHFIGTYCETEWSGFGCVQEAEVHCCFNSKLARIIHEQGRPQVTNFGGWGTVENPNCRGFTPEEFQALDFSRIDLTEYYGDLRRDDTMPFQQLLQGVQEVQEADGAP